MKILIKLLQLSIVILVLSYTNLEANSIFSFDGFPNQESNRDIYGQGMGETGIGDTFRRNTGYLNPSLSTTHNQVFFSTGIMYGQFYYFDSQDNDFREDGLHFPYFNLTIPLQRHRMGFDFAPLLTGNNDFYSYDQVQQINGTDFSYTEINKVRSYVFKGSLFYAYKHRLINAGFSLDYYLGHRFRAWTQEYSGVGGFVNPKYEINHTFREPGITIGVNRRFGDLSLGAMYRKGVTMSGKKELVSKHTVFDLGESRFELPHKIGVGSAYRITDNYKITFDTEYELWGETDSYPDASDVYKVGFGFAYEPYWGHDKFYQKIPLRTGIYYRTFPFQVNDNDLTELGFTFGLTIPLQAPNSQLDFAFKYLTRGNTDDNKFADRSFLVGIGLSGFDFFRSRTRRIADREIPEAEFEGFR